MKVAERRILTWFTYIQYFLHILGPGTGAQAVTSSYRLEGEFTIDMKTGDTTSDFAEGDLTHSEVVEFDSKFKGHIGALAL